MGKEGEVGKEGVGGGIKTSGEVAEWKKTEPKRYLLEKIALAKKVTDKYKTEYEEVKRRKEAQLKEKEKIKVDILLLQKKLSNGKQKLQLGQLQKASKNTLKRSVNTLLKLPERWDGGKSKDDMLDNMDAEIAIKNRKDEEFLAKLDQERSLQRQKQDSYKARMKKNYINRCRLQKEITQTVLKKLFTENKDYLQSIYDGETFSSRHVAFHQSEKTRQAMFYKLVTEPFSDDQINWTLEVMEDVWVKDAEEKKEVRDYIWKVLMPSFLIKIYADFFGVTQGDAKNMIMETPVSDDSGEEL